MSQTAYCREHGLGVKQLNYRLERRSRSVSLEKKGFARVVVTEPIGNDPPPAPASIRLRLKDGISFEFDSGVDPAWLVRLLRQLGGPV